MDPVRRKLLIAAGLAPFAAGAAPLAGSTIPDRLVRAQPVPPIGMGTWITFDVGADEAARERCAAVLRTFLAAGGRVVDSSPMYGSSPDVIGACLARLDARDGVLAASKVWIPGRERGVSQVAASLRRWGIDRFWLLQVHNLLDWRAHLPQLRRAREQGRIDALGVTTSHGRRHGELRAIISDEPIDTVQLTYNIAEREAEAQLLPAARDRGIAVIVNRPFATGGLFRAVAERPLPPWAGAIGITCWAQFFLKFVISHPAVTVAIPATSRVDHMTENMGALRGPLPDAAQRAAMIRWFEEVRR